MSERNSPAAGLLEAGAVLPTGTAVAKDDTVDALSARRYRHPVLGERTVVRLVPATLGAAEDLTMEFLGFDKPESTEPVGVVRQQALGFPAWALVHDPANGHHALALVKEIERLARIAKSRTGAAKEGFDALGERLARSVPHFLPTFYEEAGRAFLAGDSTSYGASMFGKARDAERAYGLTIDEDRQHAVFLEFALAGALTVKALTGHARDLAARCTPADAYERFRRLCVERVLGGLPPYAAMHTDLRRLAKAAKVDQAVGDEQVLRDLFGAPAVVGAPEQFWAAYRAPLARMAAADPAIRGRLLGMFPKSCTDETWLSLLTEAGALAALTEPADRVAAGAASPDGPAGWLQRFDSHRENRSWRDRKRSPQLLALLAQMAPRLKADGVPVALCRRHDQVDLDLVDACLALGVPLAQPHEDARYDVGQWLNDSTDGRRDLVALAGDGRFLDELVSGVEEYLRRRSGAAEGISHVLSVAGLRTAVRVWLENLAREVGAHGLPTLGGHLDRLERLNSPEGLAVHTDAARTVIEHDVTAVLARTLRAGVLDELGWPAFEEAVRRFDGTKVDDLTVVEQWPHLILRVGDLVQVVGPDRVEYEHLLRIPAAERRYQWRQVLRWVDGQLLVCWDAGTERRGYWSGTADDVFTVPDEAFDLSRGVSLALPGGGRTLGARPLHVGDRSERRGGPVLSDGSAYWVWRSGRERHELREFDPATGELGRASLPAFLEDGAVDGESLELYACRLHPGPADSPLGGRDGLVGWRVRERPDGSRVGESIDGASYTLRKGAGEGRLVGALRLPGGQVCGLTEVDNYRNSTLRLYAADGAALGEYHRGWGNSHYAWGTTLVPPAGFWHYLRPRDEAGSAALRTLTDERAAALVAAARTTNEHGGVSTVAMERLPDLIAPLLPEVTDAALRAGVAGVVMRAAALAVRQHRLGETLAGRVKQPAVQVTPAGVGDNELAEVLSGLIRYCYRRGDSAVRLLEAAGAALTAPEVPTERVAFPGDIDWIDSLGLLRPAMARAASPFTPDDQRTALADLLAAAGRSGLTAPGSALRRIDVTSDAPVTAQVGQVLTLGGRRQLVLSVDPDDRELTLLDHAPDGVFGALPGHTLDEEMRFDVTGADPASVAAFLAALAEHGPAPWRPEAPAELSQRAGMSPAEATLLLAGLPRRQWERAEHEQLRQRLGDVDATALNIAARRWNAQDETVRMLALLLPDDPAALWTTGPAVDRVVAEWVERHGVRRPVRDELIVALSQSRAASGVGASELLHGISSPDTCRWLHGKVKGIDTDDLIVAITKTLPWLVYHLPAADPIRAGLPRVLDLLRARLRDPKLVIHAGHIAAKDIDGLARALGGTATEGPDGIQAGALVFPPGGDWRHAHLRTSLLDGADDPALAVLLAQVSGVSALVAGLRAVLGDQIEQLVGYPVSDEAAKDPSRSVPALVAEVAQTTGLTADAATLYLQLLALPDPTDRNVAAWTGWKPARLKAARAALAATDLVVDAKRPRAGRSLFLPGGWLALKAPHLPLETWKYGLLIGGAQGPGVLGVVLPIAPAPQLFDLAWTRVRQGDAPRFDELVTERRR